MALALLTGAAPTPAVAESETCEPDDNFVLESGKVLPIDKTLVIERKCTIRIDGTIRANDGSSASILLLAKDITIRGAIIAGSGTNGQDAISQDGTAARAGDGAPGGWVILQLKPSKNPCEDSSCEAGEAILGPTAHVAAGNGGAGGHAMAVSPRSPAEAEGGNGGDAGGIHIRTKKEPEPLAGILQAAPAGNGGRAVALGPGALARGGTGGDAAPVYVQGLGWDDLNDLNLPALAGVGGTASASAAPCGAGNVGPAPTFVGCSGDPDDAPCETETMLFGLGLTLLGSGNPDSSATGGAGGNGILYGGRGGDATAHGCPQSQNIGDEGDPGADGHFECAGAGEFPAHVTCSDTAVWTPASPGGEGGQGIEGGAGTASGGAGGMGLLRGGDGGRADAAGGTGGTGGKGGKGGDAGVVCAPGAKGGKAGRGGPGGPSTSTGGEGGDSLLAFGVGGTGGDADGDGGPGGSPGSPGEGGSPFPIAAGVSFSIRLVEGEIECDSSPGPPGDTNIAGDQPSPMADPGDDGQAGTMNAQQAVAYLQSTVPVPDEVNICLVKLPSVDETYVVLDRCAPDVTYWKECNAQPGLQADDCQVPETFVIDGGCPDGNYGRSPFCWDGNLQGCGLDDADPCPDVPASCPVPTIGTPPYCVSPVCAGIVSTQQAVLHQVNWTTKQVTQAVGVDVAVGDLAVDRNVAFVTDVAGNRAIGVGGTSQESAPVGHYPKALEHGLFWEYDPYPTREIAASWLFVANVQSKDVSVFDVSLGPLTNLATVPLGYPPVDLAVLDLQAPLGRIAVATAYPSGVWLLDADTAAGSVSVSAFQPIGLPAGLRITGIRANPTTNYGAYVMTEPEPGGCTPPGVPRAANCESFVGPVPACLPPLDAFDTRPGEILELRLSSWQGAVSWEISPARIRVPGKPTDISFITGSSGYATDMIVTYEMEKPDPCTYLVQCDLAVPLRCPPGWLSIAPFGCLPPPPASAFDWEDLTDFEPDRRLKPDPEVHPRLGSVIKNPPSRDTTIPWDVGLPVPDGPPLGYAPSKSVFGPKFGGGSEGFVLVPNLGLVFVESTPGGTDWKSYTPVAGKLWNVGGSKENGKLFVLAAESREVDTDEVADSLTEGNP